MKKIKQFFLFFVLAVCTFAFAACGAPTTYAVKFVNYDDSVLFEQSLKEGELPEYSGEAPVKEATAQYTYTFVGWDKVIAPATEDVTYKATYTQTVNKYLVKFVDEDGTLLEEKQWEYGATPSYTGETPTKEATAQYTYAFGGWDNEIATVTGEATYTATYTDVTNQYKATFYDLEGEVLYETYVDYGETPVYGGETPTLEGDVQYYYVFTGWTTELAPITENTSYRPKFDRLVQEYTVKFVDEEGNTLQEGKIAYGEVPVFTGTLPLPEDTAQYDYSGEWDKEIAAVTGDATYTYLVTGAIRQYEVKFVNEDGRLLSSGRYDYGTTPEFYLIPYKAATAEYIYSFKGWDRQVVAVAGDATYTAEYMQFENTSDVVIEHVTVDGYIASASVAQDLTEKKLYDYTAPVFAGLQASHETLKYYYNGEKVLITVYYSEIDVWDGESVSSAFVGDGTAENPYLIASGADLALLRANVNGGNTYAGKYFKMVKSVDLNNVSLMIGTSDTVSFGGNFDGNNCAIKNIATKESIQFSGLFQTILAGGKVSNLSTYGAYHQTIKFNGVVVGRNYGTIENVTNYVSITPVDEEKPGEVSRYTGSIASYNHGSIISCVNYGYIFGEQYASGIVARQVGEAAKIENCINYANVRGSGFKPAGIVGHAEAGVISGCINYGAEVRGSQYAAGIVAVADAATVSGCVNYAAIVQLSSETAGGIVGMTAAAVSNCFNYGSVSGLKYVGGIVGIAKAAVSGCTNNGAVTSTGDRAGGIVGNLSATGSINNCNNYGAVSAAGRYDVGGIAGGAEGNVENSNNYGEISAKQKLGGIVGASYANITNCMNEGNVTGTADFVGGIVGASNGTSRTISGCTNNGTISGNNYVGGIDGRPYAGELIITNCTNNGTVAAKSNYAGGIVGRTDVCHATLNGCSGNGSVSAKYPGYLIGLNNTTETSGYTIENCTTTIKNMYEIGYDSATKAPAGGMNKSFTDAENMTALFGGFYEESGSLISGTTYNDIAIFKDLILTEGEFTLKSTPVSDAKSGVIFGYSNVDGTESYYRFTTSDSADRIYLDKVVNGTITNLATHYALVRATREYDYRVVITDGTAYCYFWNDRLWAAIDLELTGTGLGLYAEGQNTVFKNYAVSENATIPTVDTLIIGHSYMDYWSNYVDDLSDVAQAYDFGEYLNIGNGGTRSEHWANLKEEVAVYNANLLIYMIGINDISGSVAPSTIVENVTATLTYLKEKNPELNVILFAVSHAPSKVDFADKISETNGLMKALCDKYNWICFADTEYAFCDDGKNPSASWFVSDGLHLTANAYVAKIVPAIEAACEQLTPKYTVKFVDEEGNVLQSEELRAGVLPVFNGTLPTLPENTDYCTYSGAWDKEIVAVTGDVTYTFIITETYEKYTVKFVNEDGSVLYETQLEWGKTPVYVGEEPTKETTVEASYRFVGWTPELAPITGDRTYTAKFDNILQKYTVKFVDEEGNTLQETQYNFGEIPVFNGTLPLPEDTAQYAYTGAWDKEIVSVTGEVTYTYLVTRTVKSYQVQFVDEGGRVLFSAKYEYGTTPEFDRIPYKAATAEYIYTFKGWNNEVVAVVADATYTAEYTQVENTYEVVIGHATIDGYFADTAATQNVTDKKLYDYTAPVLAGLTASHETLKYYYNGEKVLITVYYSEVDVWDGTSVSTAFVGEGTAENPYLIASGADLALLRANVNAGNTYAGTYFKMVKSIDLNSVSLMVGNSKTNSFAGVFDGNNCAIKNIATKETTTGECAALFKYLLEGGKVSNLSTYGEYTQTIKMNGVIVGQNYGTIENVTNYVNIVIAEGVTPGAGHRYTAGISSLNYKDIINCVNYGTIYGEQYASGITSKQDGAATQTVNCINYGTIVGGGFRCAGIIGYATSGNVTGCINYGEVRGSQYLGGIVGQSDTAVISNCINYADLNRTGNNQTGGIVGLTKGTIANCINYGKVPGNELAGGIVGHAQNTVTNCQNYGVVTGRQWVGGITGRSTMDITNCSNHASVTGTADFVGGIVGASDGNTGRTISGCVNNGAVEGVGYIGGIDGRPYPGNVIYRDCVNNGAVTATHETDVKRSSAGGIVGRTDACHATLINCQSNGAVTALSAGAYVGLNSTTETTGYVIYDSCSTTLTGNAIGYDTTLTAGIPLEGFEYAKTAE